MAGEAAKKPVKSASKATSKKRDLSKANYGTGRRKEAVARVWLQPGTGKITFSAKLLRKLKGGLKTDLNIVRTVAGIALPVRW